MGAKRVSATTLKEAIEYGVIPIRVTDKQAVESLIKFAGLFNYTYIITMNNRIVLFYWDIDSFNVAFELCSRRVLEVEITESIFLTDNAKMLVHWHLTKKIISKKMFDTMTSLKNYILLRNN